MLDMFLGRYEATRYVRLQWVDFSGIQHAQIITTRLAKELAAGDTGPFTVAQNCMIIPISTAPRSFAEKPQAWELRPHWTSLKPCGTSLSHATVMCFMYERGEGRAFAKCPRSLLLAVTDNFEQQHSTTVLVGFEAEFVLLDESLTPPRHPVDPSPGDSTMAGLRGTTLSLLEEIVEAAELAGIHVYNFHTEGVDHFEIALAPLPPMDAVDSLMHLHETIRTICVRHGLKGTLTPKPTLTGDRHGAQNGSHLHISLNPSSQPESFLAGILGSLGALCAIGMPNFDSYSRRVPDGTGIWIGFGTENRDLPVRKISDNHWEFRFVDATANFYLLLATILQAGSEGISQNRALGWKDLQRFPHDLTQQELLEYGISQQMPHSLRDSVDILAQDDGLKFHMGEEMHAQYLHVKEIEIENFAKMTDEERRQRFLRFF